MISVKVKVTIKFTVEQAMKARWGGSEVQLFFFNLGGTWWWAINTEPQPLYPREEHGTWVGPTAGLDRCGKSRPNWVTIPEPLSTQRVAIPITLPRPTFMLFISKCNQSRDTVTVFLLRVGEVLVLNLHQNAKYLLETFQQSLSSSRKCCNITTKRVMTDAVRIVVIHNVPLHNYRHGLPMFYAVHNA